MKRIWFKPKYHTALRLGLGYEVSKLDIMKAEAYYPKCGIQLIFDETNTKFICPKYDLRVDLAEIEWRKIVPKFYTTRTHPLKGEYYVVEGSRFKARPVEPRIEFNVTEVYQLSLEKQMVRTSVIYGDFGWRPAELLDRDGKTYPEIDLGIQGATFETLRQELFRMNKNATENTYFYVNKLERMEV